MKKKAESRSKIAKKIIHTIMDRAIVINKVSEEHCRDFRIMVSERHPETLILRWVAIDISDVDRPVQCYRYECFDVDGSPQHCSIYYADQQEANDFFSGLKTLHTQECAVDHTL